MAEKLQPRSRPGPVLRALLRAPIALYRAGLGGLLGGRFLLLHHVGRRSGKPRRTVLEVVKYDPATQIHYVAAGFGDKSDWFQNLMQQPDTSIEAGSRRILVHARLLDDAEAGELLVDYAHRHAKAARSLMRFCGYQVDGSDADYRDVARLGLHFVALQPRAESR